MTDDAVSIVLGIRESLIRNQSPWCGRPSESMNFFPLKFFECIREIGQRQTDDDTFALVLMIVLQFGFCQSCPELFSLRLSFVKSMKWRKIFQTIVFKDQIRTKNHNKSRYLSWKYSRIVLGTILQKIPWRGRPINRLEVPKYKLLLVQFVKPSELIFNVWNTIGRITTSIFPVCHYAPGLKYSALFLYRFCRILPGCIISIIAKTC